MSWSVNAFDTPPFDSRIRSYSFGATFFEPLNIMCSKTCEMPVMPGRSLREPTRNHCQKVTTGTEWSSRNRTMSPFDSSTRSTFNRSDQGVGGGEDGFEAAGPDAKAATRIDAPAMAARRREGMRPPTMGHEGGGEGGSLARGRPES